MVSGLIGDQFGHDGLWGDTMHTKIAGLHRVSVQRELRGLEARQG